MSSIEELRKEIETIDMEMITLFEKRMSVSSKIATYKRENNMPVLDKEREKALIAKNVSNLSNKEFEEYYTEFFTGMLDVSKKYQHDILGD
ncbi:MAG: chorismate mutase [Lachnospiraceae bacterium]|nr:chorismate mutase [Lachnospiraceae bacterium]